jgi:Outer membrane protein beta-barrel domain
MNKSVVMLLIVCGVFAGTARQASAQGGTWADRGYINVGWGVESGSSAMTDSRTQTIYDESATITSSSTFSSGSLFDVGVGIRIFKNLTVGVGYHQEQNDTEGTVSGQIPSPVVFNRPRALTGTEPLDRKEMATHLNIGWVLPLSEKVDVMVYGGPSFFRLTQEVINEVVPNETGATASTITATIHTAERKKSVTGFNVGADATYIVWQNDSVRIGAGGFVRFTQASTDVEMFAGSQPQPTDVGGVQFGFGARLRF